jgi:hypothetical protein
VATMTLLTDGGSPRIVSLVSHQYFR